MTVLRDFLYKIDYTIDGIDNQSLGIINSRPSKKIIHPQAGIEETFTNPIARLLAAFARDSTRFKCMFLPKAEFTNPNTLSLSIPIDFFHSKRALT